MLELQSAIEKELAERRAKLRGPYSKMAKEASSPKTSPEKDRTGDDVGGCGGGLKDALVRLSTDSDASGSSNNTEEAADAQKFIAEQTLGAISEIVTGKAKEDAELMPPPSQMAQGQRRVPETSPGMGLKDTIQVRFKSSHTQYLF